jgi:hypothetical protein
MHALTAAMVVDGSNTSRLLPAQATAGAPARHWPPPTGPGRRPRRNDLNATVCGSSRDASVPGPLRASRRSIRTRTVLIDAVVRSMLG